MAGASCRDLRRFSAFESIAASGLGPGSSAPAPSTAGVAELEFDAAAFSAGAKSILKRWRVRDTMPAHRRLLLAMARHASTRKVTPEYWARFQGRFMPQFGNLALCHAARPCFCAEGYVVVSPFAKGSTQFALRRRLPAEYGRKRQASASGRTVCTFRFRLRRLFIRIFTRIVIPF